MTANPPGDERARAAAIEVILEGLRAYAPDEVEMYGHDEAEMIADYVVPFVADAVSQAVKEKVRQVPDHTLDDMWHMACEAHPWLEWPHEDCPGPGMPVSAALKYLGQAVKERDETIAFLRFHKARNAEIAIKRLTKIEEQAEEIARLNDRVVQTETSWRSLDAGIAERVQAAVSTSVAAERAEVDRIVNEWEAAYPEDVFKPFTAADHPHVSPDRIAANMGRHMARSIRKQLASLRAPTPAPTKE